MSLSVSQEGRSKVPQTGRHKCHLFSHGFGGHESEIKVSAELAPVFKSQVSAVMEKHLVCSSLLLQLPQTLLGSLKVFSWVRTLSSLCAYLSLHLNFPFFVKKYITLTWSLAKTLFPDKITFTGTGIRTSTSLGGQNSHCYKTKSAKYIWGSDRLY